MTTDITFTPAAAAIVKAEIAAHKRDAKRHVTYVAEMNVTLDTVADHVAAFREAFKAANPNATGDEVKAFATKVRNGLNRVLGKAAAEKADGTTNLLTTAGIEFLSQSTESVDDLIKALFAEVENRTSDKA